MTQARPTAKVLAAALWMGGALASFLMIAVAGRELSAQIDTSQTLFWRSLVGLAIVAGLVAARGWRFALTRRAPMHIFRNVIHFSATWGWFYGVAHISLGEVFAIEFTAPIWTLILAALLLKERVTPIRLLAVGLGFAGILVILRPGVATVDVAQLTVLWAAFGFALTTYVMTKSLVRTDQPLTILFYMTLIQMPIGLAASLDGWAWPSGMGWFWVVVVGVGGLTSHYCLARALRLADATLLVPIDFLRLPLAILVGFLAYNEAVDWLVFVGAVMIFAGNYINVRAEAERARAAHGGAAAGSG